MSTDRNHTCHGCGGHVVYASHAKGQVASCPHCGHRIVFGALVAQKIARATSESFDPPSKGRHGRQDRATSDSNSTASSQRKSVALIVAVSLGMAGLGAGAVWFKQHKASSSALAKQTTPAAIQHAPNTNAVAPDKSATNRPAPGSNAPPIPPQPAQSSGLSSSPPPSTAGTPGAKRVSPSTTNQTAQGSATNSVAQTSAPSVPVPERPPAALPENEDRTFRLKDQTEHLGRILHADAKGLVIKLKTGRPTSRIPWTQFDPVALAGEPKIIAYRKAVEEEQKAAELARLAAAAAAENARLAALERAKQLAEARARQEKLLDQSIKNYGWKRVHAGYLRGWGNAVSIGQIFAVVAPGAVWSANKLAENDSQRYDYYLVEANWTNTEGKKVAMQYLVDADGSGFRLHGCFVSGVRLDDNATFLTAVKEIYEKKKP